MKFLACILALFAFASSALAAKPIPDKHADAAIHAVVLHGSADCGVTVQFHADPYDVTDAQPAVKFRAPSGSSQRPRTYVS